MQEVIVLLWLSFAVFLYIVCAVLLVAEIFIPSFGLLTILAISCAIGSGVIFFSFGTWSGVIGIAIGFIIIPVIWIIAYKLFPQTRLGKEIILQDITGTRGRGIPDNDKLQEMLGKKGVVITPLRPVGMCDFQGHRLECVAETGYVEKDKQVEVIEVEGTQITVRIIEKD